MVVVNALEIIHLFGENIENGYGLLIVTCWGSTQANNNPLNYIWAPNNDNDNENDNENHLLTKLYREKQVINTIYIASYV